MIVNRIGLRRNWIHSTVSTAVQLRGVSAAWSIGCSVYVRLYDPMLPGIDHSIFLLDFEIMTASYTELSQTLFSHYEHLLTKKGLKVATGNSPLNVVAGGNDNENESLIRGVALHNIARLIAPDDAPTAASPTTMKLQSQLSTASFAQRGRRMSQAEMFAETHRLTRKEWREFEVDVWSNGYLSVKQFCSTTLYESVPVFIAIPLCWAVEGKTSSFNRFFVGVGAGGKWQRQILMYLVMELLVGPFMFYFLLAWYFLARDPAEKNGINSKGQLEVHASDVIMLGGLKLYRALCIGMKYGYFSESEIMCVQGSIKYKFTCACISSFRQSCKLRPLRSKVEGTKK